jgi:RNA polymerase sigma factor (TIGR02999 family)
LSGRISDFLRYTRIVPEFPRQDVSAALATLTGGDESAAAQLMDAIYDELRALAGSYFQHQPDAHTLQPTALVHEAFVKVASRTGRHYEDRAHFLAVCAVAMRGILADYARRRGAAKRGGGWDRVGLEHVGAPAGAADVDALGLDEALRELAERSERQARVVEYRFFAGMSDTEIARVLGVSRSTVQDDWRSAKAWLGVRLRSGTPS